MRRWFAILLLALLPLQFSWAAVAAYCSHEATPQGPHIGHHEHHHEHHHELQPDLRLDASAGALADAASGSPAASHGAASEGTAAGAASDAATLPGLDLDCGHCHGASAGLPAPAGAWLPGALGSRPPPPVAGALPCPAPVPPERPQWPPLA
ncbi:hypothetical protein [Aquabacterium sp. OR-4]|uniref:hypothetical protein n=1 Tax=Aquabacterium sp. OR-4 TaxID=2978127 RepID=UPI0021B3554B|nr:hypothetical protein [Aquabacterium sp. OR-4]MDT7838492.1 hypothetical protein [Aquabacterium sp. OR-4]